MSLLIYPPPKRVRSARQILNIRERSYLKLTSSHSDYFCGAVRRFADASSLIITFGQVEDRKTLITLFLKKSKLKPEAYQIRTSNRGYLLYSGTEIGLFRGLATLQQIISADHHELPHISIEDEPDFQFRGVMLDISRCKVPTLTTLKGLIDSFALLKYNQLQLYTEHTFAFTNHQQVWAHASPYTAADILEIQSYCNERYIELVPNLNCFGHFERWLRYPEYFKYAECPQGFAHPIDGHHVPYGSTLRPNALSLKLLDELHGEFLPNFDSGSFNVGGDEPWELGKGWSKSRCEKIGSTNVYIDFLSKINKLGAKRGRQTMFWSDIVLKQPESLKRLSRDSIAMNWGYEGDHPFKKECEQMASQRIPYYVCPGTSSWNSLTGRIDNATRNLSNAARNGLRYGAKGYLVTDWGDNGHHQYLPVSYPGFALGACESWNHRKSANIDLIDLVNQIYFQEPDANAARLLVSLGKVLELAPSPIRNATIFNRLLFWRMQNEPGDTQDISNRALRSCNSALQDIKSELASIRTKDQRLLKAEIRNAIAMSTHGLRRLMHFRGASISASQGASQGRKVPKRSVLRNDLRHIISQHKALWLSRNRPGGLPESANRLKRSLKYLE